MRSKLRIFLIALAVMVLGMAGSAAAEVGIGSVITGGIAQESDESAAGTKVNSVDQLHIKGEAILNFSGSAGPVSGKFRVEATQTGFDTTGAKTPNNLRHEVDWAVTDAFHITISGMSFGFGPGLSPYGASSIGHLGSFGSPGDMSNNTQLVFAINQPTSEFEFSTGPMKVGVMLSGAYLLSEAPTSIVQGTAPDESPVIGGLEETMSLVPYFSGNFGDIDVHVYYATATGTTDANPATPDDALDVDSTELSLAGIYTGGGLKAVLQYAMGTIEWAPSTGSMEAETSTINLGVEFGPVGFHYITATTELTDPQNKWGVPNINGTTRDETDIAVAFTQPIAEGATWSVAYGQRSNAKDTVKSYNIDTGAVSSRGADETDSQIMFSVRTSY